jgi:hypothetical protein
MTAKSPAPAGLHTSPAELPVEGRNAWPSRMQIQDLMFFGPHEGAQVSRYDGITGADRRKGTGAPSESLLPPGDETAGCRGRPQRERVPGGKQWKSRGQSRW